MTPDLRRIASLAVFTATLVALGLAACTTDPIVIGIERARIVASDASPSAPSDATPGADADDDSGVPTLLPPSAPPSDPDASAFDAAPTSCSPDGGCPTGERCYWPLDAAADAEGTCYPSPPAQPPTGGGGI